MDLSDLMKSASTRPMQIIKLLSNRRLAFAAKERQTAELLKNQQQHYWRTLIGLWFNILAIQIHGY